MMENEIVVDNEACYVYLGEGDNIFVKRTIITKEAFIKCYKKWVEGDGNDE